MSGRMMEWILGDIDRRLHVAENAEKTDTEAWFSELFWLCQRFSDAMLEYGRWYPSEDESDVGNELLDLLAQYRTLVQSFLSTGVTGEIDIDGVMYDIRNGLDRFLTHTDEREDFLALRFKERQDAYHVRNNSRAVA